MAAQAVVARRERRVDLEREAQAMLARE